MTIMNKPRILIVENSVAVTGALKSIMRSSHGLTENFTFIFLLPKNSAAVNHVRDAGFEVHQLDMRELRKNIFSIFIYLPVLLYNAFTLLSIVRKLNIHLVVVNDFYNLLPSAYRILRGKVPYVCYVRFLPSKFPKAFVKSWCALHLRYAQQTIAVSKAVLNELPFKQNVVVIGNELPAEACPFTSTLNSTTILYPANYISGKGHEFALESFALIYTKHPEWKLKFVGGDMGLAKNREFKESLIKRAHDLKISDRVEWHNFSEKISDEYLSASIVLNFSESESFSMTCLEAMFYGRPVIATRSGGPSEIIDQNETGILVDLKDTAAMADAMKYLIGNPDKREDMARRAYHSVRQKFSFANTIEKLGEVYRKFLKS